MQETDIRNRFEYHAPDPIKVELHEEVRSRCLDLALLLNGLLPEGRDKSLAMTKLEEVMYAANASIARNDLT